MYWTSKRLDNDKSEYVSIFKGFQDYLKHQYGLETNFQYKK